MRDLLRVRRARMMMIVWVAVVGRIEGIGVEGTGIGIGDMIGIEGMIGIEDRIGTEDLRRYWIVVLGVPFRPLRTLIFLGGLVFRGRGRNGLIVEVSNSRSLLWLLRIAIRMVSVKFSEY